MQTKFVLHFKSIRCLYRKHTHMFRKDSQITLPKPGYSVCHYCTTRTRQSNRPQCQSNQRQIVIVVFGANSSVGLPAKKSWTIVQQRLGQHSQPRKQNLCAQPQHYSVVPFLQHVTLASEQTTFLSVLIYLAGNDPPFFLACLTPTACNDPYIPTDLTNS